MRPCVRAQAATRHEIVARVGRLSCLNGSLVADQERRDAEIRYLRRVLGLVEQAKLAGATAGGGGAGGGNGDAGVGAGGDGVGVSGAAEAAGGGGGGGGAGSGAGGTQRAPQRGNDAVAASHPRMAALLGVHGQLATHNTRVRGSGKMGEDMLQLTLTCVAASAAGSCARPTIVYVPFSANLKHHRLSQWFQVSFQEGKRLKLS